MTVDVAQPVMKIDFSVRFDPGKAVRHALNFDLPGSSLQKNFLVFDLHLQPPCLG
jgi:hypothetical protein